MSMKMLTKMWTNFPPTCLGYIIVIKRSETSLIGKSSRLLFQCDRGGTYRSKKTSTKVTSTQKIDCPFRLKGVKMRTGDDWMVRVVCGTHNHAPATNMEGHSYPDRLSEFETQLTLHLSTKNVKPRDILTSLKKQNPDNVSTIKTVYNARHTFQTAEKAGKTHMQVVMSFLQREGYIFESRTNAVTNEPEDLFFAHPGSLERWHAFPHMLLMDATYKTNRYKMPLFEIVGVTATNMTFCIAFVFLHSEKVFNYSWALRCLHSTMDGCTDP
ncbi:PKS-NRPS hybrid synthetase CHGG_01239-like [Tripterygium wilfordii]|uniref:PKS-NRPS hybrid synthetase CHGG_01239-like n=1 Tax=Tripterygium wilfordii TaxID=458696 RepID=UPI0018F85D9B|nr:PKS-NRPS hybrid synthetase CHGG_01239-like [Tripterygium wilfordii]